MVSSLLDNDFYTFTVGQLVWEMFPTLQGRYEFKCRNKDVVFDEEFVHRFRLGLMALEGKPFTSDEIFYLKNLGTLSPAYLNYLTDLRFRPERDIGWNLMADGTFNLWIQGTIAHAIFYEVPILAIINEAYFAGKPVDMTAASAHLDKNIDLIKDYNKEAKSLKNPQVRFVEMGTRRRLSSLWHTSAFRRLYTELPDITTSNVLLAKEYGLVPQGTQSHQLYQIFQATGPLCDSLKNALDSWLLVHRGNFPTVLTDIVGSQNFYNSMDPFHWDSIKAFRHDSADENWWLNLTASSIRKAGIATTDRTVLLSNALDVPKALNLHKGWKHVFKELIPCIGTKFTNHTNLPALNIVIKLTTVGGQPVAKLSDDDGKGMCKDKNFVDLLRSTKFQNDRARKNSL